MSRAAHRRQGAGLCRRRGGGRSGGAPPDGLNLLNGGTFTRSTEGSYLTGAPTDGTAAFLAWAGVDVRRIENRGDGLGLGLLLEGSRTNLLLRSRDFANAAWTAGTGGVVTADAAASPDGTTSADRCQLASGFYAPYQDPIVGVSQQVCMTAWLRTMSGSGTAQMGAGNSDSNKAIQKAIAAAYARAEIQVNTLGLGHTDMLFLPFDGRAAFTGGIAQALDYCTDLMQMEAGYFPTSPIRTTAAAVTRGADALSYTVGQYPAGILTRFRIVFAPDFSDAELIAAGSAAYVISPAIVGDTGQNALFINGGTIQLYSGNVVKASRVASWSRGQQLTITVDLVAGSITIAGASSGNGTTTGSAAPWPSEPLWLGRTATVTPYPFFGRVFSVVPV